MVTEGTFCGASPAAPAEKFFAAVTARHKAPRQASLLPIPCIDSTPWFRLSRRD
jgi:hypothetical protein